METLDPNSRTAINTRAHDEAREIAQGVGIIFDSLQDMVDDIERKLIDQDNADPSLKQP